MAGRERRPRRDVLTGASTLFIGAMAGCGGLTGEEPLSWREAFIQSTSEQERQVLRTTPIVVEDVTSKEDVQTAVKVLGWNLAAEQARSDAINELEEFAEIAEVVNDLLTRANRPLNQGLELVNDMKEASAFGQSVWDVAINVVPRLELYVEVANRLNEELETRSEQAALVSSSSTTTVTQMNSVLSTDLTSYDELISGINTALTEYEAISEEITSIQEDVNTVREIGREVTDAAGDIPEYGDEAAQIFGSIFDLFGQLDRMLESFQSGVSTVVSGLTSIRDTASDEANSRYQEISSKAGGSETELDVMQINIDTSIYNISSPTETQSTERTAIETQWEKTLGTSNTDNWLSEAIGTSDDGYLVVGYKANEDEPKKGWIVKVRNDGTEQWETTYNGSELDCILLSVTKINDSGYLITGYTTGENESGDGLLIKLRPDGNVQWSQTYGGDGQSVLDPVIKTGRGNFIVAGDTGERHWIMKVSDDGSQLWERTITIGERDSVFSLLRVSDSEYLAAGQTSQDEDTSGWIGKFNGEGTILWERTYTGVLSSLAKLGDNNYLAAGHIEPENQPPNGLIIKLREDGQRLWEDTYDRNGDDKLYSLAKMNDRGYLAAGHTTSAQSDLNGWIVRFDEDGTKQREKVYGSNGMDDLFSLQKANNNDYIAVGTKNESFTEARGAGWMIKLSPN